MMPYATLDAFEVDGSGQMWAVWTVRGREDRRAVTAAQRADLERREARLGRCGRVPERVVA